MGRIRIDAFDQAFAGTSGPIASQGTPYNVPLPGGLSLLRVTSVNGIAISSSSPFVNINEANSVVVAVEARNIPLGTVVQIHVISEALPGFTVDSTPLAGTLGLSTATGNVTFPPGFSSGFVRATFDPPAP